MDATPFLGSKALTTSDTPKSVQNPEDIASPEFLATLQLLFPQITAVGLQLEDLGFTVTVSPHDIVTRYGSQILEALGPEDLDCLASIQGTRANNDRNQSYFNLNIHLYRINERHAQPVFVELRYSGEREDWLITDAFESLDVACLAIKEKLRSVYTSELPPVVDQQSAELLGQGYLDENKES